MIELTRLDGAPLWVNPDAITTIEKPFKQDQARAAGARIRLGDQFLLVRETVDEAVQATERD